MRTIITVILSIVFLISSCDYYAEISKEPINTNILIEEIIVALNNEDAVEIKALFSKQALQDAKDLDKDIEYMFSTLNGKILSWKNGAKSASISNRYGKKLVKRCAWYDVYTDDADIYRIVFSIYEKDTENPLREGIYMIQIIPIEMVVEKMLYDNDEWTAGIYCP